jgi:mannose-6-phosphate isomerase-like protein (cupin superfamily)
MNNTYTPYPSPYFHNTPRHSSNNICNGCKWYPCPYWANTAAYNSYFPNEFNRYIPYPDEMQYDSRLDLSEPAEDDCFIEMKDYGPEPFVVNINEVTKQNDTYRTALWTGCHLQLTLMSIKVGEDIGLETHPHLDQFIRIEEGEGIVKMGDSECNLNFQRKVYDDFAFIIPAGKWHNLVNTGNIPLKLYSIYAPPQHPQGTVHVTKADAQAAEEHNHH